MLSILVVDDEIPMRDLVAQMIARRETEFQVVGVAGDGAQALELARQTCPDIVITDIYMPVCGGIEFLQRAQAEGLAQPCGSAAAFAGREALCAACEGHAQKRAAQGQP